MLAAGCGGNSSGGTDTTRAGPIDGGVATGCAIPQAHRAVAQNCPPERSSIVPVDTTSCADSSRITCSNDADCTAGRNGRCLASDIDPCQTYCSYDHCLTDTDCPEREACVCRSSGASTAPNVCAPDSNCRTDSDCGECGFCSPSIVGNSLACLHHLDGGAVTTCGVAVAGNGTEEIEIDLGGCAAVLSLAYACHTMNDECINDSDCPAVGGYCAYVDEEKRWACTVCKIRNHL
jgi:hypothetical protein